MIFEGVHEDIAAGRIRPGNEFRLMLMRPDYTPNLRARTLDDVVDSEASGEGYRSGGLELETFPAYTSHGFEIRAGAAMLEQVTLCFGMVVLYDASAGGRLVAVLDWGDVTELDHQSVLFDWEGGPVVTVG